MDELVCGLGDLRSHFFVLELFTETPDTNVVKVDVDLGLP